MGSDILFEHVFAPPSSRPSFRSHSWGTTMHLQSCSCLAAASECAHLCSPLHPTHTHTHICRVPHGFSLSRLGSSRSIDQHQRQQQYANFADGNSSFPVSIVSEEYHGFRVISPMLRHPRTGADEYHGFRNRSSTFPLLVSLNHLEIPTLDRRGLLCAWVVEGQQRARLGVFGIAGPNISGRQLFPRLSHPISEPPL